jgi:predicted Zn-dependent peptidase
VLEKERGTILAEQTRKSSNPVQDIFDLQASLLFQGTSLQYPVLGTDESVRKITRDDLLNYKEKYLTNGRVAYFISGDFTEQEVIDSLNKINDNRRLIELIGKDLPIIKDLKQSFKNITNSEQNYISLSTRLSPIVGKREQAFGDIFNMIFGQGNISRIHKALRNDKGLVYSAQSNISSNPEFATFTINTSCRVDNTREVIKVIRSEVERIISDGIDEKELEQAKKNILRNLKFESETSAFWVQTQFMMELTGKADPILPDEYVTIIKSATVSDINSFASKYLANKELMVAGIGDFNSLK